MSDSVLLSTDGGVATVTLNRPDRLNAIDLEMANALRDTMLNVERDPTVRAVVARLVTQLEVSRMLQRRRVLAGVVFHELCGRISTIRAG